MWKLLAASVAGPSHQRAGLPCQDACLAVRTAGPEPAVLLCCADGAGSAGHADTGARLACEHLARAVGADFAQGQTAAGVERDTAVYWFQTVRRALEEEADRLQARPRELACTLLVAVVGEAAAAFAQLGDGAIVRADGDEYVPVFWPPEAEYANCTDFLTDADFADRLLFARREGVVEELALFSDGLQRLALDYAGRTGHRPFFAPLFQRLREVETAEALEEPLRQFLSSPRLGQRSDDDKTLLLATRVPPRAAAPLAP